MVINPLGEVIYSKTDVEDTYNFTLEKEDLLSIRKQFPFLKDADGFLLTKS